MFSTLPNVFVFLESKHGVKTAIVVADFADGAACYDDIRRSLESKDVGVLVNNVGVIPEYPMYLTEVNPLDHLIDYVERYFA